MVFRNKCVVLLSGGLDSAVTLALAIDKGHDCYALSFDYGQRHRIELYYASRLCNKLDVRYHKIFNIDMRFGGDSALTGNSDVPTADLKNVGIPLTYVPARNSVFLSIATAWAETIGASDIYLGANNADYSGYPDCRPEFFKAFEDVINLGTKAGITEDGFRIRTPLIKLNKSEIIALGLKLGINHEMTFSCYNPIDSKKCGVCDACVLLSDGLKAME
jgi:7-cyano-7-deazaguanine synthase